MIGLQSMQFFTKYKDLFEIPEGLSMPASRLQLDNSLFIDKPYVNTYTQEYTLNSKLRQLKKDYNAFESQINALTNTAPTPKRSVSRKAKSSEQQSFSQNYNENRQQGSKQSWQKQKQQQLNDKMKRQQWLQDEQNNILKHSEIDHIFNNKLNKIYQLDEIPTHSLPKVPKANESLSLPALKPKNNNFTIRQRSKPRIETSKDLSGSERVPASRVTNETAAQRREKAASTLQFRRKRLQQLLRTLW